MFVVKSPGWYNNQENVLDELCARDVAFLVGLTYWLVVKGALNMT
jgi:hypothetical protein